MGFVLLLGVLGWGFTCCVGRLLVGCCLLLFGYVCLLVWFLFSCLLLFVWLLVCSWFWVGISCVAILFLLVGCFKLAFWKLMWTFCVLSALIVDLGSLVFVFFGLLILL